MASTTMQGSQRARSRRGFAAMDPEKQREIARKGGQASGGRPENLQGVDRSEAGRKGGEAVVQKYGPEHMAEIGRRGGEASGGSRAGRRGGGPVGEEGPGENPAASPETSSGRGFGGMDTERRRELARRGSEPSQGGPDEPEARTH